MLSALSKRGESVLQFAHVVNEMNALRPEGSFDGTVGAALFSSFYGTGLTAGAALFSILVLLIPIILWKYDCLSAEKILYAIPTLLLLWWILSWNASESNSFEDDAEIAIKRAISNHGLPPKDLPSARKFTEAFDRSQLKLATLVPPSSPSSDCDLLNNPGMNHR